MCGISGIIGRKEDYSFLVNKMVRIQNHRGPDASGIWQVPNVCLGHNRLSIIDLDEAANQPFHSGCGRYVMVFNGEIYNYQELRAKLGGYSFSTRSDTEVLLALFIHFGARMMNMLNGMFSFAIWDNLEKKLFCGRDRFGVKPFYYFHDQEEFIFASEIKAIHQVGVKKQLNFSVLSEYIQLGSYGMPNETFWMDVFQLPGGHYLEFKLHSREISITKYYDFEQRVNSIEPFETLENLSESYYELLYNSVALRFVSDVPVGFNLSGGLDSSLLVTLVNKTQEHVNDKVEAYTFFTGHPDYDELPWVEKLLNQGGNPLNKVKLRVEDIPFLTKEVAYFQDEPFGGFPTLAYSQLFHFAREKGVKVLLDGQGMDEAWAGYDYYQSNNSNNLVQGVKSSITRPGVFDQDFISKPRGLVYPSPFDSHLKNLQYRDLFYTKIPRALRFNDRISMQYSVELREPFLDYRLVELAFAQPDHLKIKNGIGKWFLRHLGKQILPADVSFAPKRPLQTPQREWLKNELKDWAFENILQLAKSDFVSSKQLFSEWDNYQRKETDNSFYVWQWINLNIILNGNV